LGRDFERGKPIIEKYYFTNKQRKIFWFADRVQI
jgi:hypothetical protein